MTATLVFVHRFSHSVSCKCTIADRHPEPGQSLRPTIVWTGKPTCKHFSDYRRWTFYVLQTLSNHWDGEIACALLTENNNRELWLFRPTEAPRLIGSLKFSVSRRVC
jgi:hypothetical protein